MKEEKEGSKIFRVQWRVFNSLQLGAINQNRVLKLFGDMKSIVFNKYLVLCSMVQLG